MVTATHATSFVAPAPLADRYLRVRELSLALAKPLAPEDQVVQTIPEVSPTKWHLAHTTWLFEHFVLGAFVQDYVPFNEHYHHLFNSYYYTVGDMFRRPDRGLLSRPTAAEIKSYRHHVDKHMLELLADEDGNEALAFLILLGVNHEQQHQELMLTDIKHVLSVNPMGPVYRSDLVAAPGSATAPLYFDPRPGGTLKIGATSDSFAFDNETPRHRVLIGEHAMGNRLVTNAEYREFIEAGGYTDPAVWLADGWAKIQESGWNRPLYWSQDLHQEFTLAGWRNIDDNAPVSHVSFYEADAYARAFGARLPSEAEWELAARDVPVEGNLLEADYLHPAPAGPASHQFYGDVWEWTASPYTPYPGFKPLSGSLGEYNGKFMSNQMVVRGGSCVTSTDHIRASYRSFFYPHDRWQFLGIRLAKDA